MMLMSVGVVVNKKDNDEGNNKGGNEKSEPYPQ